MYPITKGQVPSAIFYGMRHYYIIFFSFIGIVQEHTDRYVQTLQNFQKLP